MSSDPNHQGTSDKDGAPVARAPSHAERARTLAAEARTATLCTLARDPSGYPFGSLVTVAVDAEGRPLLLLSELAEHTGNLAAHPEASVLITEPAGRHQEPLASARVTILGPCRRVDEDASGARAAVRAAFLAAHPDAASYAGFRDFAFYCIEPVALRYVGGFGRISWVSADDYRSAEPDPLTPFAEGILTHMNEDHGDAVLAYAKALARIESATAATMVAVDRYGFEIHVATPVGARVARLAFDAPVSTRDEVRKAMVDLVRAARAQQR